MRLPSKATMFYLLGYWVIGVAAGFCFKESGTDVAHRWHYLVPGCSLGVVSTWFLVRVYVRMHINLAMLVATGGAFILGQVAFWLVYHTPLTLMQCAGFLMVLGGMTLTLWQRCPAQVPDLVQTPSQSAPQKATL